MIQGAWGADIQHKT